VHLQPLKHTIGYETLTLISYGKKSTDLPSIHLKGGLIAKELYQPAVPTCKLLFDLRTHTFIAEAEKRVTDLSRRQHLAL
jgi:hypothetical protein